MEQLLRRNVKRFRGGLVLKAHRLVYHSTLGLSVIKKKTKSEGGTRGELVEEEELLRGADGAVVALLRLLDPENVLRRESLEFVNHLNHGLYHASLECPR